MVSFKDPGVGILRYEELDTVTRRWMLEELIREESRPHYVPAGLSDLGLQIFPLERMRAITKGDEDTFARSLMEPRLWEDFQPAPRGGVKKTDPVRAAETLARMEFNTLYVRGLTRRTMEEGEEYCQIYLAGPKTDADDECTVYENRTFRARIIYEAHRAKYWPVVNEKAFSIPSGPECRHSVRRLGADMRALIELEERRSGASYRR